MVLLLHSVFVYRDIILRESWRTEGAWKGMPEPLSSSK